MRTARASTQLGMLMTCVDFLKKKKGAETCPELKLLQYEWQLINLASKSINIDTKFESLSSLPGHATWFSEWRELLEVESRLDCIAVDTRYAPTPCASEQPRLLFLALACKFTRAKLSSARKDRCVCIRGDDY